MLKIIRNNNIKYFFSGILLIFTALLFRYNTFFYSHIDDDEGIYILMGHFINKGFLPYVHYFDHQPPLIYYLAAFVQNFNIDPLIGVRSLGLIFVILSSYVLFFISEKIFKNNFISLIVSLLYILFVSVPVLGGCGFNNEIIFNLFSLLSFLIIILNFLNKNIISKYFISGLIIGLGLITKQQVVFDLISFIFLIILLNYKNNQLKFTLIRIFYYILGSVIPGLLFLIYYYYKGHLTDFLIANLFSNFKYINNEENIYNNLRYFLKIISPFYYLILFSIFPLFFKFDNKNIFFQLGFKYFLVFWSIYLLWSTTLSKTFYVHYYIQCIPVLTILIGCFLYQILFIKKSIMRIMIYMTFFILLVIFTLKTGILLQIFKSNKDNNYLKLTADYINTHKSINDTLYVATGDVTLYVYTDIDIPTRYAFPIHLSNIKYEKSFNINQHEEVLRILDSKPTWIVVENGWSFSYRKFESDRTRIYFNKFIEDNYNMVKEFYSDKDMVMYKEDQKTYKTHIKIYNLKKINT